MAKIQLISRRVVKLCFAVALLLATSANITASAQYYGAPYYGAQCDAPTSCCDTCDSPCDTSGACDSCGNEGGCLLCSNYTRFSKSLASSGIALQNNVTQFYMGNTTGGLEREFRYSGHGDYVMNADFGKLGIQEGLFLKIRAEHRFGESLAGTTGAFLPSNVAADLPVTDSDKLYITNFLITQALSENFVLFAGKLDTLDGDVNAFAHGRGIRQFSNLAFVGTPLALRSVPYSTLGLGFAYLLDGEPLFSFTVLNAKDTAGTIGLNELFEDGAALTSELRLPTQFMGKPGHQLFGGSWNSRSFVSLGQDPRIVLPNVPIARQVGSWSLYWNMDQYVVTDPCKPGKGWGYFARAGIADRDTNPLAYYLSAGLGGTSPIARRDNDSFGIGYYYSGTSNQIGPLLSIALGSPIGDGQGVELFYNAAVSPMLTITPDLQVISPSRDNLDTALVAGLRVNLAF
ncbi:MAG: carbohydrate porin [Planctomycetales bacterium]|nr:carbohydrate porin [Planctomycetales bacterium]